MRRSVFSKEQLYAFDYLYSSFTENEIQSENHPNLINKNLYYKVETYSYNLSFCHLNNPSLWIFNFFVHMSFEIHGAINDLGCVKQYYYQNKYP